ncbi:GNAT family N-acetyltransferase [Streptococcus merionis]|uniref:Putative GNAT-family acetyltransferase n=1 Tax=Streptococcus merionis TaxID=400065 RepID=A0A239SN08_9STRE|nr:GNAT family N-acetyltransferase [Streptococcus merionis]SNU86063.1 putative GNAT-family acetyltransferase [Streptococcus merionis]
MLYREIQDSDIERLEELYQKEKWTSFKSHMIQSLKDKSHWVIAEEDGNICGFARYITDGVLTVYLCELIVATDFRQQGIGRSLIQEIFSRHVGLRIDLASFNDDFYDRLSFRKIGSAYRNYGERNTDS